ncbi:MAG: hypothetical protein V3U88_07720 [Methylococcales bacterium]
MKKYSLKASLVILVAILSISLTACDNSDSLAEAQKPVEPLSNNTSAASQREARLEREAEKLRKQEAAATSVVEEATSVVEKATSAVEEAASTSE